MPIKSILRATAFGALFAAMPFAAHANTGKQQAAEADAPSDASFRISTGIGFSKGDYGEVEDTEVFAVPIALTYSDGPLKVRVSVPWVQVDGPGSLLSTPEGRDNSGGGGQGRGRGRGGDSDNSGSGGGSSGSGNSGSGSSGSEVEVEDEDDDDVIIDDGGVAVATADKRTGFGDVNVAATYSFDLGSRTFFEP